MINSNHFHEKRTFGNNKALLYDIWGYEMRLFWEKQKKPRLFLEKKKEQASPR
jgi:hypothetical protein